MISDELRVPIQTTAAVLLAYVLARALGMQEVSWVVFSALFVVQASVGGTIGSALERMAGGLAGAVLGIAVILLFGNQGNSVLVSLAAGVVAMSLIALRWPALSYGLVTVAVIAVTPDPDVIDGALEKALAISLGSCCGMLAGLAVFPALAWRSAGRQLSHAVRGVGDLLDACTGTLTGRRSDDRASIHSGIETALRRGREMAWSARLEKSAHSVDRRLADTVTRGLERFWYSLAMLDRVAAQPLPERVREALCPEVDRLADATRQYMHSLASVIERCRSAPPADEVRAAYDAFVEAVDALQRDPALSGHDREYALGLKWGWFMVVQHVEDLTAGINRILD